MPLRRDLAGMGDVDRRLLPPLPLLQLHRYLPVRGAPLQLALQRW